MWETPKEEIKLLQKPEHKVIGIATQAKGI